MVIRSTLRTFAIALAVAMLAACASGADVVRHVPVESAAVVHAVPAPPEWSSPHPAAER